MVSVHNEIYVDLLNRIIESQRSLYGTLAIAVAGRVEGIRISKEGVVLEIFAAPEEVIRDLIDRYQELGGEFSKKMAVIILTVYKKQYPDMAFPEL